MNVRLSKRDRRLFGLAGAFLVVLAGLGVALSVTDPEAPSPAAPLPPPQEVATLPAPPPPVPVDAPADKAQERAGALPDLPPGQRVELDPPFLILDGLTFAAGPTALRLSGLDGPGAKATCRGPNGHVWACGLQARAALNNALRNRRAICTPTDVVTDGIPHGTCMVDGGDLGQKLVAEGWARPPANDPGPYAAALETARADRLGLWSGDWSVTEAAPRIGASADLRRSVDGPAPSAPAPQ